MTQEQTDMDTTQKTPPEQSLIERLRIRAEIRRQILTRKSVQEGAPDRIADLLEEAATEIEELTEIINHLEEVVDRMLDEFKADS